jgi:hypothetical protein
LGPLLQSLRACTGLQPSTSSPSKQLTSLQRHPTTQTPHARMINGFQLSIRISMHEYHVRWELCASLETTSKQNYGYLCKSESVVLENGCTTDTIDTTDINDFEIDYIWLGIASIIFYSSLIVLINRSTKIHCFEDVQVLYVVIIS